MGKGTFMIFMSYWFFAFAVSFFSLYWLIPVFSFRKALIIGSGLLFQIHFAGPAGVLPIVALSVLTYLAGLSKNRKIQLSAIIVCVASLIFYKYTVFLISELIGIFDVHLAQQAVAALKLRILPELPPLAVSFFVFEFVHYLTDIVRGEAPIRSVRDFTLFAIFWPTMVAGPIKRYEQFLPSVKYGCAKAKSEDVMTGMIRLAMGILKKFIADNLTLWIAFWIERFSEVSLMMRWGVFFAIGLRILLDFSGYSDMAIGFSRMMGIKVPENFNWPYLALGPIDFWHRWHISLSTWIRDYVYIPLGGGRVGLVRKLGNGLIAFSLCGLWHGAGWNFLVWGIYHGLGVSVNNVWRQRRPKQAFFKKFILFRKLSAWFCTLMFVLIGWVLFFYPLPKAWEILILMVGAK